MLLDFVEKTGAYVLKVLRSDAELVQSLMRDHGLDFSTTASTVREACLFTREPYAAAAFGEHATPHARQQLGRILEQVEASWRSTSAARFSRVPPDKELWDFQRADLEYALQRKHCLIGDQPGLGKTPVAICYANEIEARHVLVICPANIRLQWARRISEWTTMRWPYYVHSITNSRRGVFPTSTDRPGWNIVSYDLARTEAIGKALSAGVYDLVILDEAHYLKTIDSKRTRAIFGGGRERTFEPIAERSSHILALTGTPLPNRPREAYTLSRALCWDAIDWLSEDGFNERFNPSMRVEVVDPETGRTKFYVDERSGRHAELQNRLRANFMVRHLKREVMPQLKMPVYDLIQIEETGAVKAALKAESLLDIDPEDLTGADADVLGHVAVVRRLMGVAMAPQVADYIQMLIDGGEWKLVLFAWHIEVLDILQGKLQRHGLVRIDGSTSAVKKQKLVDEFRTNPNIGLCIGNMQSMGVGTDGLQDVAYHGLIAEPSWTPGDNIQAFDRLDRGGQRAQVQADIFVVPGSFAERVLASVLRKLNVTHAALDRRITA